MDIENIILQMMQPGHVVTKPEANVLEELIYIVKKNKPVKVSGGVCPLCGSKRVNTKHCPFCGQALEVGDEGIE